MSGASPFHRHQVVAIRENGRWTRATVFGATMDGVTVCTRDHFYQLSTRAALRELRCVYVLGQCQLDVKLAGGVR